MSLPKKVPHYDPSMFDESYYGQSGNNGFGPEFEWDNPKQQEQLQFKLRYFADHHFQSMLFVGCARGGELRFFRSHGKQVKGVDVSKWAIAHAYPDVKKDVALFDGLTLPHPDKSFDVVACFDVLTFLPRDMMTALAFDMQRVAKNLIVFRATFKTYANRDDTVDGQDGVIFKAPEFYDLDRAMSSNGFGLKRCEIDERYIGVFWYVPASQLAPVPKLP